MCDQRRFHLRRVDSDRDHHRAVNPCLRATHTPFSPSAGAGEERWYSPRARSTLAQIRAAPYQPDHLLPLLCLVLQRPGSHEAGPVWDGGTRPEECKDEGGEGNRGWIVVDALARFQF